MQEAFHVIDNVIERLPINLSHKEQLELWHNDMLPKIGAKNSQKVWDLVVENHVSSFDELRRILDTI